jgi:Zn-dependent protease with chaperone function
MNFFEQQDRSRRATRWLVGAFAAAILFICCCVYGGVILTINFSSLRHAVFGDRACQQIGAQVSTVSETLAYAPAIAPDRPTFSPEIKGGSRSRGGSGFNSGRFDQPPGSTFRYRSSRSERGQNNGATCQPRMVWFDLRVFFWTLVSTAGLICTTSLLKYRGLRAGGAVIAAELGGVRILPETAGPQELQLLNIIEEVSIAALIAPPPVYVLYNESSINAFAAGFAINDAVIGVTLGSLEKLDRDELQAVIAHEFSHILNGDMAMNIRLTGMLHGIMWLNLIGKILSFASWGGEGRKFWMLGMFLRCIGFSGFISGRLIQSAISRQREFLADASAVQFTRNTHGIASALAKIGGADSRIRSPYAETASHMFFGSALDWSWLEGLFATHPPLERRIAMVQGVGKKLGGKIVLNGQTVPNFNPIVSTQMAGVAGMAGEAAGNESATTNESGVYGALAYTYALLLDEQLADRQLAILAQTTEPSVLEQIPALQAAVAALPPQQRLAKLEQQLAQLRRTPHTKPLVKSAYGMIDVLPLTDWHSAIIYMVLHHRLAETVGPQPVVYQAIEEVGDDLVNILGMLARLSCQDLPTAEQNFTASLFRLPPGLAGNPQLPPATDWRTWHRHLLKVASASPRIQQSLMVACLEIFSERRQFAADGLDLMRVVAILLDSPIPPLLQRLDVQSNKKPVSFTV